jgi:sugar transferase EpsL
VSEHAQLEAARSRPLDRLVAGALLVMTSPLAAGVALAVRLTMGSPVLFRQQRAGAGGQAFAMIKFRTMRDPRPGEDGPEFDGARLTRLGRFLRATSLDELPTFLNVVQGRMNLVGPRPLPVRYLERYSADHARRHEVPPGITGYAQVHGRNQLDWDSQLDLDVWYVDHRSLRLDLRVLGRTLMTVVRRDGISQEGHDTRPEFPGSGQSGPQVRSRVAEGEPAA